MATNVGVNCELGGRCNPRTFIALPMTAALDTSVDVTDAGTRWAYLRRCYVIFAPSQVRFSVGTNPLLMPRMSPHTVDTANNRKWNGRC